MNPRQRYFLYIIIALIAIGMIGSIIKNPGGWIIPLLIFGLVFYLYKFPPKRRNKYQEVVFSQKKKSRKRTKHKFKVINGNKKIHHDDDEKKYPYH